MRLDQYLVEHDLAPSRARAQALIAAGVVALDGRTVFKPSQKVGPGADVSVGADPNPWVSRAGLKLAHALDVFGLVPQGVALDLGASTGGFTQVLLARGAAHVHALDVGHGQLHPSLATDHRITQHTGVNAREIPAGLLPPVDWVVADLSFISLTKALGPALALATPGARLIALIKPQFELGPDRIGKGGIVRKGADHRDACDTVREFLESRSWQVTGETESPIRGGNGNREFLIAAGKTE